MMTMTNSPATFIRREQAPFDSLLKGQTVVYQWDGRLWRCSEAEWKRLLAEQIKEKVK